MRWPELQSELCQWFIDNARDLPWRRKPTPYRVWVSEIMLQQTRTEAVVEPFRRFMRRFPSLAALARAQEDEVLEAWSGLGYYRRARLLHAAARAVPRVPDTRDGLLALPGIGRYTAGAILSIAHNAPAPIVDGNIERVFARWLTLADNVKSAGVQKQLWQLATDWVETGAASGYESRVLNQALMELGATVCTPRSPSCGKCPVARHCGANAAGDPERWPVLPPRPARKPVRYAVYAVTDDQGRILLRRRDKSDRESLLPAGMWELPHGQWPGPPPPGVTVIDQTPAGEITHAIMDYKVTLTLLRSELTTNPESNTRWFNTKEATKAAIASATRKLLKHIPP